MKLEIMKVTLTFDVADKIGRLVPGFAVRHDTDLVLELMAQPHGVFQMHRDPPRNLNKFHAPLE